MKLIPTKSIWEILADRLKKEYDPEKRRGRNKRFFQELKQWLLMRIPMT